MDEGRGEMGRGTSSLGGDVLGGRVVKRGLRGSVRGIFVSGEILNLKGFLFL